MNVEPTDSDRPNVLKAICETLQTAGISFTQLEHAPTQTSEESAAVRGEPLEVGAKALLLKTADVFRLFVLPAHLKLDSAAVKQELGVKKIRFASADELMELTGLVPGSVPPFGTPILPFELFADESVGSYENKVAFNAGSLTDSIVMRADDWESVAKPRRFRFAGGG